MSRNNTASGSNIVWYTEYGIPIRNLWHMLLYAWHEFPIKKYSSMFNVEDAPTLDALLASILGMLIQQRLRIGLGRNYTNRMQEIHGVRGRINFAESLKQRSFENAQAVCEFHQYNSSVLKNRIIRSTLARLVQTGSFGSNQVISDKLRHQLRQLTRSLDGIDLIELQLDVIRREQLIRHDSDYRIMLSICELVVQRQMPTEMSGGRTMPTLDHDAFMLHNIYERFVANFYRIHLKGWTVKSQSRLSWHAKYENPYLPSMQPDLILENKITGEIIILDTKFTAGSTVENQWGKQVFDSSHLYQLYAYLNSQKHLSAKHHKATGILLYPTIHNKLSEKVELEDHVMRIESVDLTAPWQEIEKRLIEIVTHE
jgi:5-methylcytosine-specific restriction enzyme subunit McrC